MKRKVKPVEDPEVRLTFGSKREAARFADRVMRTRGKRMPFTRSVYRVAVAEPK